MQEQHVFVDKRIQIEGLDLCLNIPVGSTVADNQRVSDEANILDVMATFPRHRKVRQFGTGRGKS